MRIIVALFIALVVTTPAAAETCVEKFRRLARTGGNCRAGEGSVGMLVGSHLLPAECRRRRVEES